MHPHMLRFKYVTTIHPMTSIGWGLVHIAADNWIYVEHAFEEGERNFPDLEVHGTAEEVLGDRRASAEPVSRWLPSATNKALGPHSSPAR
jgi:hypothetical protein